MDWLNNRTKCIKNQCNDSFDHKVGGSCPTYSRFGLRTVEGETGRQLRDDVG